MATTFAPAFTATQSDDGLSVLITDTSNWEDNTEGYVITNFARQVALKDALGNVLDAKTFDPDSLELDWDVPEGTNPWVEIDYSAVDGGTVFNLVHKFPFQRIYELAYIEALKLNCGCCGSLFPAACQIDAFYQGALHAEPIGDGESWQNYIDAAYNTLISSTL